MKKKFTNKSIRLALFIGLLTATQSVFAQQSITGTVVSENNEAMPGVNIVVKGTTTGTSTDVNGKFSLNVSGPDAILIFSFVGYSSEEITAGNQTQVNVTLKPDMAALQEVVVIGYGTQRHQDVTTAVASVKPKDFVPGAVRNVGELLRGKVAGLTISTSSGDPEAGTEILLRGITSIYGSSAPLVLIDGFTGDMNSISPNDIESVEVLKDASASAIYGTRGKNGVILITTKKAKDNSSPVVEYSGYVSTDRFMKTADFMSAEDVRARIANGDIDDAYDLGSSTDWLDEITRNPVNHFHNISFRGGSARTRFVANASYQMAEGIFLKSENEEFKLRLDLDHYLIEDKLKLNVNILKGIQSYGGFDGTVYRQALIRNPTDAVKDANGNWIEHTDQFQYENPVALLNEEDSDDNSSWTWLTSSLSYFPINDLELKIAGSQHIYDSAFGRYQTKKHISTVRDGRNGHATVRNGKVVDNFLDLTAEYSKIFGDHRISALLGYSYIDQINSGSRIINYNFPTDDFSYHRIEQGTALRNGDVGASVASYKNDWRLVAFFGRLGYGFKNKYNVLASLRQEGSSKFGKDQKWGLFPAISAGWTISNESFLENVALIDNLKVRAGYGRTGSISVDSYESLTRYAYSPTQFYFNGTEWVSILSPVGNPNPNLGWETNTEYNLGLDFAILNGRISGTIDFYDRTLDDLVYSYPVPVPPNLVGTTLANAASITNKGIEILVDFAVVKNSSLEWNTSINYSKNKSKLKSLSSGEFKLENDFFFSGYTGDPIQLATHKLEKGKPLGGFYGYKSVGLDENGVWLVENAGGEINPITAVTDDDLQILGNGLPQWYLAWNNNVRYKKFDLSMTMRGAFDYQILNFQRMFYENPNIVYNRLNSSYDKIDGQTLSSPQSYVSYYVEDGDFWKIDNITLGYTIPDAKKYVKSARIYVSASNLITITGYKGLDPEIRRTPVQRGNLDPGNDDRNKYPTIRSFTLGFNFTF